MSTPFDHCKDAFEEQYPKHSFSALVDFYFRNGVVHATPDYFVMGRKVPHSATPEEMRFENFSEILCDCWFFAWFAGDMEKVWAAETPLEFVAFERARGSDLELIVVKTSIMRRLSLPAHG